MAKRQLEIPGTEEPKIESLEAAAEEYVKFRDRRMKLLEQEIVAKATLLQEAEAHKAELSSDGDGNKVYRYDDMQVILKPGKANVKVKHVHDAEEEDED